MVMIARTLFRYWKMAHDPKTPLIVRLLIYTGIVYSLSPVDLLPDVVPGLGLLDDAAILPGIITLAMLLVPREVKKAHDTKERMEIAESQAASAGSATGPSKARAEVPPEPAPPETDKISS